MLPAGNLDEVELQPVLLLAAIVDEMELARFPSHRPKHVELIGIINKPLLLHLVGCLYKSTALVKSDAENSGSGVVHSQESTLQHQLQKMVQINQRHDICSMFTIIAII